MRVCLLEWKYTTYAALFRFCLFVCVCHCVCTQVLMCSFISFLWLCVCVWLGMCLGTVHRGLFSSCRRALWDSIRLPCITVRRQLRNSYFWSWNKALCRFLPQQIFCVYTHNKYLRVCVCASVNMHAGVSVVSSSSAVVCCICRGTACPYPLWCLFALRQQGRPDSDRRAESSGCTFFPPPKAAHTFSSCPYPTVN